MSSISRLGWQALSNLAMTRQHLATVAAIVAAGLLLPAPLAAQQPQVALQAGDRVRITAPSRDLTRQKGTLLEQRADTLVVALAGSGAPTELSSRLLVPLGVITRLDVSLGRKGHLLQGLLLGFVGGGTVGAVAGTRVDCSGYDQGLCVAYLGVIGAGAGVLLGSVIGAVIRTERSTEVQLERPRLSIGAIPEGRFGVGLALPF